MDSPEKSRKEVGLRHVGVKLMDEFGVGWGGRPMGKAKYGVRLTSGLALWVGVVVGDCGSQLRLEIRVVGKAWLYAVSATRLVMTGRRGNGEAQLYPVLLMSASRHVWWERGGGVGVIGPVMPQGCGHLCY